MTITRLFCLGATLALAFVTGDALAQQPAVASSAPTGGHVERGKAMAMQKAKPAHGVAATKHAATSDGTATAEIEHRVGSDGLQPGRRDFLDQYQNAVTPPPAAAGR